MLKLSIEIEPDAQPIQGRLELTGQAVVGDFTGWVQLIHMVERARAVGANGGDSDNRPQAGTTPT
jgi:hypothetical protein